MLTQSTVTTHWLAERILYSNIVVLDATLPKVGQKELSKDAQNLRIPFARTFDLKNVFKNLKAKLPNTMPSPEYFTQKVQELGINQEDIIIIYDHHGVYSSPRAWWMFRTMGHQNVAILNGGFPTWKAAGFPLEKKEKYQGPKGNFQANFQSQLLKNADEVLATLDQTNVAILDARSKGRFDSTAPEPRANLKGGHIPGSYNLPIAEIIKEGQLLPPEDLKTIYQQFNLKNKNLIFSCGSGITACVIALGAEEAGYKNQSVFDGSWTEWGDGEKYPVEK